MRVLVDTHAFLWAAVEPYRLSAMARSVFEDPQHDVVLSVASIWEMEIKHQLGKPSGGAVDRWAFAAKRGGR